MTEMPEGASPRPSGGPSRWVSGPVVTYTFDADGRCLGPLTDKEMAARARARRAAQPGPDPVLPVGTVAHHTVTTFAYSAEGRPVGEPRSCTFPVVWDGAVWRKVEGEG